ncbi:hypothetical protein [Flavobacterium sp.]|jgi:hypothetical protein|uniref:HTH-like domain-containing protein n=1 Tax=Flavobacterium sp. TaxID=239 RepID=UPI0037BFD45A
MTIKELGRELREMYLNAPKGDAVAMIHLFGIMYADEISNFENAKNEIIQVSGISQSYITELSKGIKLAKYVIPK